jgi:hypothetical protein
MEIYKLHNDELENIEDLVPSIEKMYQFKFEDDEISKLENFNDFCDLIVSKIDLENVENCSSQQAFYKLRKSIVALNLAEKGQITPETKLEAIFPRKERIALVRSLEKHIGFKINLIHPPDALSISLLLLVVVSFVFLFFDFKFGLLGLGIAVLSLNLAKKFGKEMKMKSIRELVEKITQENYLKIRTKSNTINRKELKSVITNWIADHLDLEKEKLKTATFV